MLVFFCFKVYLSVAEREICCKREEKVAKTGRLKMAVALMNSRLHKTSEDTRSMHFFA